MRRRASSIHREALFIKGDPVFPVILISLLVLACPRSGSAQALEAATWGGGIGVWAPTPPQSNWITIPSGAYPDNNGTYNYDVNIGGAGGSSSVTLNTTVTIDNLTLTDSNQALSLVTGGLFIAGTSGSGTINNAGTITIGSDTSLIIFTPSVMLMGGGTVTLATASNAVNAQISGEIDPYPTLTNVDNTIQGNGVINGGIVFVNQSAGLVNANVSGGTFTIGGSGGAQNLPVTNSGTFEATGGGVLALNSATVNNSGGMIESSSGSSVNLSNGAVIQGGVLNSNGGFLGTTTNTNAYLDGSTSAGAVTIQGTYTGVNSSVTYLLGTITNTGNIQINGGNGANTTLNTDSANVTLNGGGTVTLATASGGGSAYLQADIGGTPMLTNVNNTIQGNGIIGNGTGLNFVNESGGIVNANVSGGTLTINPGDGITTNGGTLEATGGGILALAGSTINNSGGMIESSSGSSVNLVDQTQIQGGTLNSNGGFLGTTTNTIAYPDGSTSAGAVTIQGTYTGVNSSVTYLLGTITNTGNIQINGGTGVNTTFNTDSANVTLNGGGTLTLATASGGGNAFLLADLPTSTLTNVNNTIQGNGFIGNGTGLTFVNESGGVVNANVSGGTLTINPSGDVTNSGTFEANSGSSLVVAASLTNLSGTTLTGGTYNMYSGTIQLPGNVNTNAATILMDGASGTPHLENGSDGNALANFTTNSAAGSFTIQNGANFTSPSAASTPFNNAGEVTIGENSTFTVGGTNNYVQTGGTTEMTSATSNLTASTVEINGGTLEGIGTIHGNLSVFGGGIILPGLPGSGGTLTVTGNYSDPASSLNITLLGPDSNSSLVVDGMTTLTDTTLNLSLGAGFSAPLDSSFVILQSDGGINGMFTNGSTLTVGGDTFTVEYNPAGYAGDVVLVLTETSVPEPASLVMLTVGMASVGAYFLKRRRGAGTKRYPRINEDTSIHQVRFDPKSIEVKRTLALVSRQQKDLLTAERAFQELTDQAPADSWPRNQLALVLAEQSDPVKRKRALELAEVSVRQNPKAVAALATLGTVYYQLKRLDDAEKLLQAVVASGKANSDAAYILAKVRIDRGQPEAAISLLKIALKAPGSLSRGRMPRFRSSD